MPSLFRQQAAALCYREEGGGTEVLLITGRGNQRWGIPKGTIELGENSSQAAQGEAFEEAGVRGTIEAEPIGVYHYFRPGRIVPYEVQVHMLRVIEMAKIFPELGECSLDWTPLRHAPALVARQGLGRLLDGLEAQSDYRLIPSELCLASN